MRLIDADELMDHVYNDKLDSRELIAQMVNNAPTIMDPTEKQAELNAIKEHVRYLNEKNNMLIAEVKALAFAVRCGGISGKEVRYEID